MNGNAVNLCVLCCVVCVELRLTQSTSCDGDGDGLWVVVRVECTPDSVNWNAKGKCEYKAIAYNGAVLVLCGPNGPDMPFLNMNTKYGQ